MRRIAYEAEWVRIRRNARSAATRLASAKEARQNGNTRLAGRLFRVLASRRRTPPAYRAPALAALAELRAEAEQRMTDLEARLAASVATDPPSSDPVASEVKRLLDQLTEDAPGIIAGDDPNSLSSRPSVVAIFAQMDELVWQYETVPGTARSLRVRLGRLRRDKRFAATLKQPQAAAFWELGQRHENADERCCAYLAYERAARLMPAPSAQRAEEHLKTLAADPLIEASVARCRRLRECHKTFQLAELLNKAGRAARARASFEEVAASAPADSRLHAEAMEELARLDADG